MAEQLAEVPALPRDTPLLILNGFTNYSMPEFFDLFELILKTERIIQFENDGYRHDDRKCLKRVKKLTMLARKSFQTLNVSNLWSITSNHRNDIGKTKGLCDNYGGENYSPDCPHPRGEAKINKAKEERAACRGGGVHNGGRGSGRGGGRQGDQNKWSNNKKDEDINDYGNSVQNRGNAWMCAIAAVKSVDGMPTILMYFMLIGRVIMALLPCLLTMIIGICKGRLLVSQLELDPLMEADQAINTNAIRIFLK